MHSKKFLDQTSQISNLLDPHLIESMVERIASIRKNGGRLFFIGSGGGAGHASHAVNDFRKITNLECYTPTDNVSELTARINDDGWETSYSNWLKVSKLNTRDGIFVFSVGGGSIENNISMNLVRCIELAKEVGASILGVAGKNGGFLSKSSDLVCVIPTIEDQFITPHTEGWQAVVWHLIVSHPLLLENQMKWESQNE